PLYLVYLTSVFSLCQIVCVGCCCPCLCPSCSLFLPSCFSLFRVHVSFTCRKSKEQDTIDTQEVEQITQDHLKRHTDLKPGGPY
ncbi:hypothetical protein INR49_003636, partial [Caranx melampygus]